MNLAMVVIGIATALALKERISNPADVLLKRSERLAADHFYPAFLVGRENLITDIPAPRS